MTMAKVSVAVLLFAVACFASDDEGFYTEQELSLMLSNDTDVPMPQNVTDAPMPGNDTDAPIPPHVTDVPMPQHVTDAPSNHTGSDSSSSDDDDDDDSSPLPIILGCVGGAAVLAGAGFALMKYRTKTTPEHENLLEDPSVNTVSHVPGRPEELRRSVYDPSSDTHQTQDTEVVAE
eukprot:TRINITY_DN1843_c0_g1_i1.p2 TRINITY_DN1843_c0_g1~~TRINITY_DN1843_c0_g1_i1.p2  ORF type:complete len:202 (+),score=86.10 TRINITY_DN1843_c0_g1_i1:80-607(+)